MRLTRRIRLQLAMFTVIAISGVAVLLLGYVDLPARLFGIDRYRVTVELPESAGLYANGNVTYRGTEVGLIQDVRLTADGVSAVMSLDSRVPIPSDLTAEVHSVTALGEQYIALTPRSATAPPLRDGDVIPRSRTAVPAPIDRLLDSTNRGLEAIPRDNLKTMIDESYIAVGNLGAELSRIVDGSTKLAIDAADNQDALIEVIDRSPKVLDSQTASAGAVSAWADNLASITEQLRANDGAVAGLIDSGGPAADEARQLLQRLQPTVPLLLANLVSVGQVGITYQPNLEQILVLAPQGVAAAQAGFVPNLNIPGARFAPHGLTLSLNTNLPPPCTTGFLPAQQRVAPSVEEVPERPAGNLYCRIPQDSPFNVRGARNIPCAAKPWKRAPTVKMCESDEEYVPLNDGMNWKGDPNATLSGQDIPQLDPEASPPAESAQPQEPPLVPPIATAQYDPATGTYRGPDGRLYTQRNLARTAPHNTTWQQMLMPPEPTK
ncbi:MlaD family protein [Mycolicibacterium elephantis]|uniref:MCE family protein n=1 Tax=Mycolicibacterium elephantis TaxID=81858 RepID=UPI0007EA039B|nr:MlaD family protein [Mycolicibacterium elephantis]OBB16479.1 mammalian cell entry protein [Mycolicibacterium elephantis]OBE94931.1 mammalian cell entry protein [Mycolicibacterium elephantis]